MENELTRNLLGNARQQSSQLFEPLWTDPVLRSGTDARQQISIKKMKKKKKKQRSRGMICRTFPKNLRNASITSCQIGLNELDFGFSFWKAGTERRRVGIHFNFALLKIVRHICPKEQH